MSRIARECDSYSQVTAITVGASGWWDDSSSWRSHPLMAYDHDVASKLLRAIVKRDGNVEQHREAIILVQAISDAADGDIDNPLLHPDLLCPRCIPRAGPISDS